MDLETNKIIYNLCLDELILKKNCHICKEECKFNYIYCTQRCWRIWNKYGYQTCIFSCDICC
jgi:hypothetical protein